MGSENNDEMLEDLSESVSRFTDFLSKAKESTIARWRRTSLLVKLALWAPFQAVMFKIQPVLWEALTGTVAVVGVVAGGFVSELASLRAQTQLILVLIGILTVQTTVVFLRMDRQRLELERMNEKAEEILVNTEDVIWTVEEIESEVEDVRWDGGEPMKHDELDSRDESVETTGTGALGGAVAGGAFGASVGGPAGAIGGAVLGLILGDEAEKGSIRNEEHSVETVLLNELVTTGAWERPIPRSRLFSSVSVQNRKVAETALDELAADRNCPVTVHREETGRVRVELSDRGSALEYLRRLRAQE